jgi:protein-tyrosine-phosphatase
MAEGLARHIGKGRWEVASAGTSHTGWVSPEVHDALSESGIDSSGLRSKGLDEFDLHRFQAVVILSSARPESVLPDGFQGLVEEWHTPDPVGQPLEAYRQVRDELDGQIRDLLSRLTGEGP